MENTRHWEAVYNPLPRARVEFEWKGQKGVAIQLRTGEVEVYRVTDGLEEFVGYSCRSASPLSDHLLGLLEGSEE